jgi:hypothetical protein
VLRWPLGLGALFAAVTALFQYAPRRRQPGLSRLAVGAGVTVLGWLVVSVLLGVYISIADSFDDTYGPLTAVMALLLWANLTGRLARRDCVGGPARGRPGGPDRPAARRHRRRWHPGRARRKRRFGPALISF